MFLLIVSCDNIENVKEALYFHCKGRKSLKVGGLMKLRSVIDSVLHDTSKQKFRIVETCHYLKDLGYIETKQTNVFSINQHFITSKLWLEMQKKEQEEALDQQEQGKLW